MGKAIKEPKVVTEKVALEVARKIHELNLTLIQEPLKITPLQLVAKRPADNIGKTQRSPNKDEQLKEIQEGPLFDEEKVTKLGDVPPLWLWMLLRKASENPITDEVIQNMSKKSHTPLFQSLEYLSGDLIPY